MLVSQCGPPYWCSHTLAKVDCDRNVELKNIVGVTRKVELYWMVLVNLLVLKLSFLFQIADKCHLLGNFNSLKALLAGLQSTPVYRLKETWKEVPSKRKK